MEGDDHLSKATTLRVTFALEESYAKEEPRRWILVHWVEHCVVLVCVRGRERAIIVTGWTVCDIVPYFGWGDYPLVALAGSRERGTIIL